MTKFIFSVSFFIFASASADVDSFIKTNVGRHEGHLAHNPQSLCVVDIKAPEETVGCGGAYCVQIHVSRNSSWLAYPGDGGWAQDEQTITFNYGWPDVRLWKFGYDPISMKILSARKSTEGGEGPLCIFE